MEKVYYVVLKIFGTDQTAPIYKEEECTIDKETPKTLVVGYREDSHTATVKKSDLGIIKRDLYIDTSEVFVRKAFVRECQLKQTRHEMLSKAKNHFDLTVKKAQSVLDMLKKGVE